MIAIFLLAVIQGIAEFLPISSSGHILVLDSIFKRLEMMPFDTDSLTINILLHLGSLLAIIVFYHREIWNIIFQFRVRLMGMIAVASIPAAIIGFSVKLFAESALENLLLTGIMFFVTAALLVISHCRVCNRQSSRSQIEPSSDTDLTADLSNITWRQSIIIGISQAFAIFPGLSRSGTTICTGLLCGVSRRSAAAFSFLLAIPVIAGAGLLETLKLVKHCPDSFPVTEMVLGLMVSFAIGLLTLKWLISWLEKGRLTWFAAWLVIAGTGTIALALIY